LAAEQRPLAAEEKLDEVPEGLLAEMSDGEMGVVLGYIEVDEQGKEWFVLAGKVEQSVVVP